MTSPLKEGTPLYCVTGALCKMHCNPAERECDGFCEQDYVKLKRELRESQARCDELEKERILEPWDLVNGLKRDKMNALSLLKQYEKDAARFRFLAEQHNEWHVEQWKTALRGSGTWIGIRGAALANAIDSALSRKD